MNPLVEFYIQINADDYKWTGAEYERSVELGKNATEEHKNELVEHTKQIIAKEKDNE